MESFLPSEIARLVLGYLEDQKCEEAYTTFLKTSIHLEECMKMREVGRKFRTQVLGLSLLDILYEYSAIYSLVQERLKKVDPEAVERLRHSGTLLDKITFLLNSTSSGQTMLFSISLPPGNSPQTSTVAHAHVRKRLRTCSSNDKRKDMSRKKVCDNNDMSIIEASSNINNLETTNLSSLPGNAVQNLSSNVQENDILRTPKRKAQGNNNKRQSRANSVVPEDLDDNFDITALTQALLDNHELHEKIAENINKVICTPENNSSNVSLGQETCSAQNLAPAETNASIQNSNNFTMELDNVIKKIVHDTESDPIFENFLQEVVGPSGQEETTSDDYDDRGISTTSTPSKSEPETVKKQNIKNRNRGGKLKRANSSENIMNTIDDHNAVAIESIISINAPESDKICPTSEPIKMNDIVTTSSTTVSSITSTKTVTDTSVIISESVSGNTITPVSSIPVTTSTNQNLTVDTTTNTTSIEQQQNKNVIMPIQQPTFVIADSFPSIYQQPTIMPDNRIIFLSNKTPAIGSQYLTMPPTFQLSQPTTVISDNDILNMPTVFISDDPKTSSGYIISQSGRKRATSRKQSNKTKTRTTPRNLVKRPMPSTSEVELTKMTQETETVKYTISIQAEPKQTTDTNDQPAPSTSNSSKTDIVAEKSTTPDKPISTSSSKVQLSLSSPRSNKSHIRALDFSTPPKEDQLPRPASTSPKSLQKISKPQKSPKNKKQSSPQLISPVKSSKVPITTKSPKVKLKGEWNQDLIAQSKKSDNDKQKRSSKLRQKASEKEIQKTLECTEHDYKFCECVTKPVVKKLTSWDHELRSLIVPVPSTSTAQPKKTPAKKRTRSSQRNKDAKEKKTNLNTTEIEVSSIEAELAKMEGIESDKEPIKETLTENLQTDKEISTEESKTKESKLEKRKKQTNKSKPVAQKVETNNREDTQITPEKLKETESPEQSSNTSNSDLNKSIPTESLRNMTPKIRKKCNTNNSSKKTSPNSEENKSKSSENGTNNQTFEIKKMATMSPIKMDKNTSKRTLVESQTEKESLAPPTEVNKSLPSIITPNMLIKATCSNEVTAKRNLIPVLETPMKDDSLLLPITPRLFTPFNLDSPLTRLLGEKMDTGDLAPFLSPSFPMTPSFPITPNLQSGDTQSSYASRPTDYSNSSSYYQPSDSEQNQKLEQVLIDEAMKIETSDLKTKHIKTSTPCKETNPETKDAPTEPIIVTNCETPGVTAKVQLSNSLLEELNTSKKTGNMSIETLTASSANTSSFSSCSDYTKENINKDGANITVIHAVSDNGTNKTPSRDTISSSLNNELCVKLIKTPLVKEPDSTEIKDNKCENNTVIKRPRGRPKSPLKRLNDKNKIKRPPGRPRKDATDGNAKKDDDDFEKHRELKSNVTGSHVTLLKELEEKRKRIITGLKATKSNRPKKTITKETIKTRTKETVKERTKETAKELIKETNKEHTKDNSRVTRARVNKIESKEKSVTNKLAFKVAEPPFVPRKSKTPQKATIESVAAKLLKDKKYNEKSEILATNIDANQSFSSPIYSVGSPNVNLSIISHEDGLVSYTPDEELPHLHISSDEEDSSTKSKTNEKQIDNSDLLVKELKERGIYLIPNKEKKTVQLIKEKSNDVVNELQKENDEKKTATEQLKNKEKFDKIKIKSDIHLDKSEVIDLSKIELSQGVLIDVISRTATKNVELVSENIVSNKNTSQETVNNSDSTLDISESSEYDFHVKVIDESSPEYIHYLYDETNKTKKHISDYNFTVLKRNISAKIFIEEFDKWEDKLFTVTPYTEIFSIKGKRKRKVTQTNKPSQPNETITKPVEAKIISQPIEAKTISATEEAKTIPKIVEVKSLCKTVEAKTISRTPETKTNLKPLEILYNECIDESSTDTIITIKESEPKMKLVKSSNINNEHNKKEKVIIKDTVTSNKSTVKKTISLEQYKIDKIKDNTHKTTQKTKGEVDLESVEIVDTSVEEDLMNYAVTNKETYPDLSSKKRKATEETIKQNTEKRIKPDKRALLKSIDVDSFLTQLHGSSEKS